MAVRGYTWLYMGTHGYTWHYIAIHDIIWLYMALHRYTWLYMALHCYTWHYMAIHGITWLFWYISWYTLITLLKVPTFVRHFENEIPLTINHGREMSTISGNGLLLLLFIATYNCFLFHCLYKRIGKFHFRSTKVSLLSKLRELFSWHQKKGMCLVCTIQIWF